MTTGLRNSLRGRVAESSMKRRSVKNPYRVSIRCASKAESRPGGPFLHQAHCLRSLYQQRTGITRRGGRFEAEYPLSDGNTQQIRGSDHQQDAASRTSMPPGLGTHYEYHPHSHRCQKQSYIFLVLVSGCGSRCFHTNPKRQRGRRAYVGQRPRSRFGLVCTQKRKSHFLDTRVAIRAK